MSKINPLLKEFIRELNAVRLNESLLKEYAFSIEEVGQIKRLRLCIALYNDFQESDFPIALYLFKQEKTWRQTDNYHETGDVDALYFSAFVLTRYGRPEVIFKFWETKQIDFDCGIGFDGEFLLATGIQETFNFLSEVTHPFKSFIFNYIGKSLKDCNYTDEDLQVWKQEKKYYFEAYITPEQEDFLD